MLDDRKRHIRVIIFSMTVVIFAVLIVLDMSTFLEKMEQENHGDAKKVGHVVKVTSIKDEDKITNIKRIEDIVKLGNIKYTNDKETMDNKNIEKAQLGETISQDDGLDKDVSQDGILEEKTKIEEPKINIYASNPWRIKIPSLRLDAPITEGTTAEALRRTVGHFPQTDKWKGNVALAGHNRGYRCNFFGEIKKLKKGDIIIYQTEKGERTYKVTVNTVIKETDWSYIENTKNNRITLITCEMNKREYRRCIQAEEIKG